MKIFFTLISIFILSGCANFNNAMTAGAEIIHDDFDNATIVRQDPVNATASLSEAWHLLGFEWTTKKPDTVIITAGLVMQNEIVGGVEFKVDGALVDGIADLGALTDHNMATKQSTKRFSMPLTEFRKLASARTVKMRISYGNNISGTSTFGTLDPAAIVSKKFPPFLAKIDELRFVKQ